MCEERVICQDIAVFFSKVKEIPNITMSCQITLFAKIFFRKK